MKTLVIVLLFAYAIPSGAGSGGSGTVGDGGTGVICKFHPASAQVELYDLFEARVNGFNSEPSFGTPALNLNQKVVLGLSRLPTVNPNYSRYVPLLRYAANEYLSFAIDPWETGLSYYYGYFLQPNLVVTENVGRELDEKKCRLADVAIRPSAAPAFDSLCDYSVAGRQFCLAIDKYYLRQMSADQQACLIIHECLRFVRELKSEEELRKLTAQLCTSK